MEDRRSRFPDTDRVTLLSGTNEKISANPSSERVVRGYSDDDASRYVSPMAMAVVWPRPPDRRTSHAALTGTFGLQIGLHLPYEVIVLFSLRKKINS